MSKNLKSLIPYFDYREGLSYFCTKDLEFHILNSYARTFYFPGKEIPEIWDISDYVQDGIAENGIIWLDVGCFGYPVNRQEITIDLIELTLVAMKAEFINMEGEHVNDCQNILLEEWLNGSTNY